MKYAFQIIIALLIGFIFGCVGVIVSKPDQPTAETLSLLSSLHNDEWEYELKPSLIFNDHSFNRHSIRLVRGYWWASVQDRNTDQSLNHRFSFRELSWINDQLDSKLYEYEQSLLDKIHKSKKTSETKQLLDEHEDADELLQSILQESSQCHDLSTLI